MMPINNKRTQGNTTILHARSDSYFWKGKGPLSIKTFKNGRAFYHAGHGNFAVDEGKYLEKTYNDNWLAATLFQIKSEYTNKALDITWLEEKLYNLAHGLLNVHRQVNKEISKLQSLRASTREELYKRIHIGHEFITAYFDQPITLADAARAACLSPNHFLRSYKQLFSMSPHQYLTERRLQESKRLLLQTDKSITDICLEVGFQSPSSFSSLFSKRFSMAPSQFRKKVIFKK